MAKIPLAVLDRIMAQEVGGTGTVERITGEHLNPISITIREAVRELGCDIAAYRIEGGLPEVFSMPGFDPAAVGFSTRCVEVVSTLLRLFESASLLKDQLVEVSERTCLETMAELALKNGDCAAAVFLISQAALASPQVFLTSSTILGVELEQYGETNMAVLFYGLLHELGHVRAERNPEAGGISPEDIRRLADVALPDHYGSLARDELSSAGRRAGHPLDEEHLRTEIIADSFAADIIWCATKAILDLEGRQDSFDPLAFALVIMDMFDVFVVMSTCKLAADHASRLGFNILDEVSINLAHQVRLNAVARHVAELLALHEVPAAGSPLDAGGWHRVLAQLYSERRERRSQVEAGMERALRTVLHPWEHEPGCGSALVSQLRDGLAITERMLLRQFLDLSRALSLDHPDLRKLDALIKMPGDGPGKHSYQVALVFFLGNFYFPLGVDSQYGYLIFAFVSHNGHYAKYRQLAGGALPPGTTLQDAAIKCDWEYELTVICTKLLPDDMRLKARVVVEGTPLFDRLMNELIIGTIWAPATEA